MPKAVQLKTSRTPRIEYDNPGTLIVVFNPAPYATPAELQEAQEAGQPILHHRENTPWYLTVADLGVTLPIEVEGGLLTGYVKKDNLLRMADDLVTQLKSLPADALNAIKAVTHDFANWTAEDRRGQLYFNLILNNDEIE